jgi:hypothetical protein
MDNIINWITDWFTSHCDGDWEHDNMIKITTTDNPGWSVTIDLVDTGLEDLELKVGTIEKSEHDWYFYLIREKKYFAAGDLTKLEFLLTKFKEIVESNTKP